MSPEDRLAQVEMALWVAMTAALDDLRTYGVAFLRVDISKEDNAVYMQHIPCSDVRYE